jgi:NAD(P)-dependent dehydrogenase (short-subunit alcohol dehydrogenase family)
MKAIKESLTDRVALVTGAGSGIGKNAAKLLAYANAKVALLGHTKDEIEATARELTSNGHEALALIADLTDPAAMEKAIAQIKQTWGRLDIVVANAGINGVWAPIEEIKVEEWDETLSTNLRGTFLTLKYSVPLLKAQGGSVIIIASVNGNRIFSNTGATAYSCSKAGQVAMAKMLAVELGPSKVRVNVVCPGQTSTQISDNTEQRDLESVKIPVEFPKGTIPLTGKTPGTSGEVAELIWFLASDYSDHISGTEVYIDGAQSLLKG